MTNDHHNHNQQAKKRNPFDIQRKDEDEARKTNRPIDNKFSPKMKNYVCNMEKR